MFGGRLFVQEDPVAAIALIAFFLLLSFPVHEFAHALAAYRLGDGTAKLFGRLTLNPVAHFDQFGGTMLILSVLVAGIPLGFAQTPVNPRNLRGRHGDAVVAAAGPLSNLLIAAVVAIPVRVMLASPELAGQYPELFTILDLIVRYSILLGLFNLIPIPPLDGGAILLSYVSPQTAWQLRPFFAQYGVFLLILLILPLFGGTSMIGRFLLPLTDAVYGVLVG
ncbi:MAG TPA: site-2 protease family protein [Candidatus Limnocylindrales bacterium]|nr:site-2 protease family protein [Candidatus Limnocylindrales bacterium]